MTFPVPAHPRQEVDVPRRKKSDETDVTSEATAAADAGGRRGGVSDADREVKRRNQLTPRWWVWTMVGLMVLGLAWIVVFYLSSSSLPVPGWGNWNLVAGFALVLAGFAMTTRWR
ncbi:cell division protein CrgA [Kineococcus sp. LSe6-4]|uniref:Cell division protein CrgA n=1 Tax=Kineococcus halophytocola TaxID=3234027 RepID=A0ABV4GV11_9ACTN